MSRFERCEWCDDPSGGALLCKSCTRRQVWNLVGRANDDEHTEQRQQRYPLDDPNGTTSSPSHAEGGVLRTDTKAPRLPRQRAAAIMGGKWRRPDRGLSVMGCVRIVRDEHPSVERVVMWPNVLPPEIRCTECDKRQQHQNHDETRPGAHFFNTGKPLIADRRKQPPANADWRN